MPEVKDISPVTEIPFPLVQKEDDRIMTRRASEKVKRKMKMADLKAFVETKLLSKSEKALEKIGHDDHKFSFHTAVRMISVSTVLFILLNVFSVVIKIYVVFFSIIVGGSLLLGRTVWEVELTSATLVCRS